MWRILPDDGVKINSMRKTLETAYVWLINSNNSELAAKLQNIEIFMEKEIISLLTAAPY